MVGNSRLILVGWVAFEVSYLLYVVEFGVGEFLLYCFFLVMERCGVLYLLFRSLSGWGVCGF